MGNRKRTDGEEVFKQFVDRPQGNQYKRKHGKPLAHTYYVVGIVKMNIKGFGGGQQRKDEQYRTCGCEKIIGFGEIIHGLLISGKIHN